MCLGSKTPKTPAPPPPVETLQQAAPTKKTAETTSAVTGKSMTDTKASPLAIGSKKYRSGMYPSGINLSE